MAHPMGESKPGCLRVDFDRRLKLEFHGSQITSDGGLLAYRELDDALGLTEMAEGVFHDSRTGKNGWHGITGQFRQSVFGRLGGYDDVNDADRLGRDPAMRWVVGGKAIERQAASTSQMGRFETELLATDENVEALVDMNGVWIDKVHDRHPPKMIILDMDSSVSPTHGEQEGTAYNGHCRLYLLPSAIPVRTSSATWSDRSLRPGNVHSARRRWRNVLEPAVMRYTGKEGAAVFSWTMLAFASPQRHEISPLQTAESIALEVAHQVHPPQSARAAPAEHCPSCLRDLGSVSPPRPCSPLHASFSYCRPDRGTRSAVSRPKWTMAPRRSFWFHRVAFHRQNLSRPTKRVVAF